MMVRQGSLNRKHRLSIAGHKIEFADDDVSTEDLDESRLIVDTDEDGKIVKIHSNGKK